LNNSIFKNLAIWLVILVVMLTVFNQFNGRQTQQNAMDYSQFLADAKAGRVSKAVIDAQKRVITATTQDNRQVVVNYPPDMFMVSDLIKANLALEGARAAMRPPRPQRRGAAGPEERGRCSLEGWLGS
jgi:cell division protease FtsH